MSAGAQAIAAKPRQAPMSGFERYLTLWVALCIVAGVALGQGLPDVFQAIGRMEVAQVNLPVGLLIWVADPAKSAITNVVLRRDVLLAQRPLCSVGRRRFAVAPIRRQRELLERVDGFLDRAVQRALVHPLDVQPGDLFPAEVA